MKGRYELLETLGVGGEGRVVKALDHQHARTVALKIRAVRDADDRDALLLEARVLLALPPHPALPLVREDFFDGDNYVIAMDWVDGSDLAELLLTRGRPGLAPSSVLAYLSDVAEALTHLHAQDPPVIHGDVKPGNLILTSGGRVKLVDFGMSSSPEMRSRRRGTSGFRAPELASNGQPSRASDIYSLAATAFALLTGAPPSGTLPAWEGMDPTQAAQLEAALRLGLATDPARRPATPGELVERLRAGWAEALPTGVVTFCLSDIEGSTALWDTAPEAMARALVRHDEVLADAVESHGGRLVKSMGEGDSSVSVFDSAIQALAAAIAATTALASEPWPDGLVLKVRFALHTGEAERRGADYFGTTVNLAARLRGQADGGQVFLSAITASLVEPALPDDFQLVDLGPHRLKGLASPERVFALAGPGVDAPLPATECPYRGLLAFEPDDRHLFFGREEVLEKLLCRLQAGQLTAVVGASGSGKSSLLRAGVIGAVRAGEVTGARHATLATPGARPEPIAGDDPATIWVVDQFEELFTTCDDREGRAAFIHSLLGAQSAVVIGMRADFYGEITSHAELAQAVEANQILLRAMTDAELRRAITEPARLAGLRLEPGLADVVIRDVAGEPGALPLLSHALRSTWERRDGRTLTVEAYEQSGGVRSAVAQSADSFIATASDDERVLLRGTFLRLTELGDGVDDARRRVSIEELVPDAASSGRVHSMLGRLAEARLVTLGEGTAEVAHEVLIREWPTLRQWLDEDRESLRLHRRLDDAARLWDTGGRETTDLYRGARLSATLDWAQTHDRDLNELERQFLAQSREHSEREIDQQRRTNRRLRGLLLGAAVLLVVALVAGGLVFVQRGRARDAQTAAESQALRSDAVRLGTLAQSETAIDTSLLLGVAGVALQDLPETRGHLLSLLQERPALLRRIHMGGSGPRCRPTGGPSIPGAGTFCQVNSVAVSPDGRLVASGDAGGQVHFHDLETWERTGEPVVLEGAVTQQALVFAPDGRTLAAATATEQNEVNLYFIDAASRTAKVVGSWPSVFATAGPLRFTHMAFTPDGSQIAVAVATAAPGAPVPVGARLLLLDAATGRVVWERTYPLGTAINEPLVAFTPQGVLVTSAHKGETLLWETDAGRVQRRFPTAGPFALSPDGNHAAVALNSDNPSDASASLAVLDLRTGEQRVLGDNPDRAWIVAVQFTPDGRSIVAADFNFGLRVWDVASGMVVHNFTGGLNVAVTPDGRTVVSEGVAWDLSGRQPLSRTFRWGDAEHGCTSVPCFVASPKDALIARSLNDGRVALIDHRTGRLVDTLPATNGDQAAGTLAFFPDGRTLVTGGIDRTVTLWDVATRSPRRTLRFSEPVWWTAVSPDGALLAVHTQAQDSQASTVEVREIASNTTVFRHRLRYGAGMLAFSPDGRQLAALGCGGAPTCGVGSTIEVLDTRSGAGLFSPRVESRAISIAFSPDNRLLAAGTDDGKVVLWNARDGRPVGSPIEAADGPIYQLSFSPDSRLLAVGSADYTATLWDVESRARIGNTFPVVPGVIPEAYFAPNGHLIIDYVTTTTVWPTELGAWIDYACRAAGRDLGREEWSRLLPGRPYQRVCPQ